MKQIKKRTCQCCCAPLNMDNVVNGVVVCEYCKTEYTLESDEPGTSEKTIERGEQEPSYQGYYKSADEPSAQYEPNQQGEVRGEKKRISGQLLTLSVLAFVAGFFTDLSFLHALGVVLALACILNYLGFVDVFDNQARYEKLGVRVSPKSKWIAFGLCFFFGYLGVHYFYVGRIGRGILSIFTLNFFGIGYVIDMIVILCGRFKDFDGARLV